MRVPLTRGRRLSMVGAFAIAAIAGTSVAFVTAHTGGTAPESQLAAPVEPALIQPITAIGTAPFKAPLIHAGLAPGKAILTSIVDSLSLFVAPDGAVTRELAPYTYYSLPLTLMAIDVVDVGGNRWYQVSLPTKLNGQTGWVRPSNVIAWSTDTVIHVYLA